MSVETNKSAQQIRLWRKRRGLTLEVLARELKTSAGHLHKWETGKVSINLDRLHNIATVLGVGLHDLIRDPARFDRTPVIGVLSHNGHVDLVEDFETGGPPAFVDAPNGVDVDSGAAIEVASDALLPIPNGWLLFFNRRDSGVQAGAVGSLCVACVSDQPGMIVRRLGQGTKPKLFNLFSPHASEVLDVKLEWAAPIVCIMPAPDREARKQRGS